ncbi:redox-sensing transcriptional repressor Rex [Clostridium thermosuccinogenes]|uniref:Redox-sensing transcriptional repressor Rex n=1 Tax=Clostridium thermosuccinogenes TaxID=84032 RepID=A0A2K2FA68_9CLOT|nr:redox-sensing transcriptional repressor Rex [Pseudoclostridium thermosuccinogenes]PNT94984.1 redox-sensing transcriptional repressor Rex [Pseudoclostridium thermosuccinogenes]PNT95648.1 redox-sensing transcriptional repressor Rex [Pseudoclostridium thermosuccinogenes]
MNKKKISIAVIKRLPRYYRYLYDLLKLGITRISSKELSERMNITASQIRQDLNCFGGFGQQGYGYNVESLFNEISNILGVNETFHTIIVGAGHMGQALANYGNFEKRGFKVVGIFDVNPAVVGTAINGIEVLHIDKLDEFIKQNKVDIGILTVPYDQTPAVADRLARLGVKGLWNFSPMDLELEHDVVIENVHLSDSLMVLGYKLNEMRNRNKSKN